MSNSHQSPHYRVFLLRCWEERSALSHQPNLWRFSLEDTRSGQRRGFTTLESIVNFLQTDLMNGQTGILPDDHPVAGSDE